MHGAVWCSSETTQFHEISLAGQHLLPSQHLVARMVRHVVALASHGEALLLMVMHIILVMLLVKLVGHIHVLEVSGARAPH